MFGFGKKVDPVEEAKLVGTQSIHSSIHPFVAARGALVPRDRNGIKSTQPLTNPPTHPIPSTHPQWKRNIGREVRTIERTLVDIEREEKKIVKEIQKLAKEGDTRRGALNILAKDLVRYVSPFLWLCGWVGRWVDGEIGG